MNLPKVAHYHIHVYFDANTAEQATQLCIATRDQFNIPMGRVHEKNVGPTLAGVVSSPCLLNCLDLQSNI